MSSPEEWRIVHIADDKPTTELESRIAAEFKRLYEAAGKPEGMALFSHVVQGRLQALSMTPESVPYCDSLLTRLPWDESAARPMLGEVGWVAGDELNPAR